MQPGVDEAERVAREHGAERRVVHDEMVLGVAAGVEEAERGVPERDRRVVVEGADALLGDGGDDPVERGEALGAVDVGGARDELRRVDEVARGPWMGKERGPGQAAISAPAPPAWSRWAWVTMTYRTASRVRPCASRAARRIGSERAVFVSTKAHSPPATRRYAATNCGCSGSASRV